MPESDEQCLSRCVNHAKDVFGFVIELEKVMKIRRLFEVWRDWKFNQKFNANLGDGSPIEAVGRPYHDVCEVRSTRGTEYRHATEYVLCDDDPPEEADGYCPTDEDGEVTVENAL